MMDPCQYDPPDPLPAPELGSDYALAITQFANIVLPANYHRIEIFTAPPSPVLPHTFTILLSILPFCRFPE